jgi:hypothetical protein
MRKNTISGQYSSLLCSLIFSSILYVSRSLCPPPPFSLLLLSSMLSYPLCYLLFSHLCSPNRPALLSTLFCPSHCCALLFSAVLSALLSFPSALMSPLLFAFISCKLCSLLLPALLLSVHPIPPYLPALFTAPLSSLLRSPLCSPVISALLTFCSLLLYDLLCSSSLKSSVLYLFPLCSALLSALIYSVLPSTVFNCALLFSLLCSLLCFSPVSSALLSPLRSYLLCAPISSPIHSTLYSALVSALFSFLNSSPCFGHSYSFLFRRCKVTVKHLLG